MSTNGSDKLRILALHGYTQSASKFKAKSPLPRKFKKFADFHFITAPFRVPEDDEDVKKDVSTPAAEKDIKPPDLIVHAITEADNAFLITEEKVTPSDIDISNAESFAWYLRRPNETRTGHYYRGIADCISFLENVFREQGPFDGLYGFSQGACLVAMLCALQQKNLTTFIKFDFAIMAGAFKYPDDRFYDDIINIPSLHIYGETDQQVVPERSKDLANCFNNPLIVSHPGGHFVPCNSEEKKAYAPFIMEQWKKKFGSKDA